MRAINATHLSRVKRDSSRIVWMITRFIIVQTVDFTCACRYYRNTLCTRTTAAADWPRYVFSAGQLRGDKATVRYVYACMRISIACVRPARADEDVDRRRKGCK